MELLGCSSRCFQCHQPHQTHEDVPCQPIVLPCSHGFCPSCLSQLQILCQRSHAEKCPENQTTDSSSHSHSNRLKNKASSRNTTTEGIEVALHHVSLNSSVSRSRDLQKVMRLPTFNPRLGQPLEVYVSHILSPDQFYAQLKDDNTQLEQVTKELEQHGDSKDLLPLSHVPEIGEFVMALFSEDMNWYRGKVERVLLNEKKAEVFYVDYGNSERCSFDHLKPLPESLAKRKALAFECKLDDMIPKSQSKWKKSVSQIFKEILEGFPDPWHMVPVSQDNSSGRLLVDLSLPKNEFIKDDRIISFKEIFAFLGLTETNQNFRSTDYIASLPKTHLKRNDRFIGWIEFSKNPGSFYVKTCEKERLAGNARFEKDLKTFYSEHRSSLVCGSLALGEMVAAVFPDDEEIYRAKITRMAPPKIEVLFVDYGNSAVVPWHHIFKLADKFSDTAAKAIHCALDVNGHVPTAWDQDIINLFQKETMDPFNKKLHFYITDVDEDSDQVLVIVKEDPASQDSSSVNNLIAEKLPYPAATIATPIRSKEALSEKYGLRPFYVTHVDSPSEIYVRPASLADGWQNFKDSIESKLSNNSVRYRKEALINDLVGIVNNVNCYRGEIVDIIDPNTFLVRDIDKGSRETVRSEDMFELPECLLDVNAFCHLVSLAHILPTGTSKPGVWSQEAKEWFKEEAEKYGEVFLSIEGVHCQNDDGKHYLPVCFHIRIIETKHAFKPSSERIIDVGQKLIEEGYAIKRKNIPVAAESDKASSAVADYEDLLQVIGRPKLPKSRQTLADKKFQWPLPRIPIDDYFSGKITHVDDAGQIYLQPLSGAEELLEMEKKINKICKGITKMSGRQKPSWNVGDICLAKYPNLNWWSRGQVIAGDAQMSEVPILFVDYGEVKYLNPENGEIHDQGIEEEFLRMPMQMLRCQLDNIAPLNGVYTTSILEWLHKSIFDQEVDVKITRTPTKFPLPVIIKLKDEEKTNPARLLVKAKAAVKVRTISEWTNRTMQKAQEEAAHYIQVEKEGRPS